ncbi:segregation and condensation protein B [Kineosphaera limosa]|uniref:Segregation and condensation protein B n=1 Tax=Kineosphaera limosa NBRC 100340 TaxID=1184609 RepID=K6W6P1_9MICO|nr:segregation and condensation protein B [Kineosphaera limosa]GAB94845.1 segregation and condensation protein B [Kineosphaera limosa NBRC 100340]
MSEPIVGTAPSGPDFAAESARESARESAQEQQAQVDQPEEQVEETFDVDAVPGGLRAAVEAVLMVVEEPVTSAALAAALERPEPEVEQALVAIAADDEETRRGFALLSIGGGWRYYSRHDLAPVVEKFLLDGQRARLSQAALETLAVVAYRQPVSRARISGVRGVNVDGVVRTLLTRGLITEIGVDDEHGAVLYGTTPYFLQRLGLRSLDDLPPLAPYLPEADILDSILQENDQ